MGKKRGSGILLHITSLPSPFGIGDLGPWAYRFVDFLAETKQSYWQILPLTPTSSRSGNSPYHSSSAFASNPLLISPELLFQEGLLNRKDLAARPDLPDLRVDYGAVEAYKKELLRTAYQRFRKKRGRAEFDKFCFANNVWLDDYAVFTALKTRFKGSPWCEWPREIRDREPGPLEKAREGLADIIEETKFHQYIFLRQWLDLRKYCNQKGIRIIGDLPIYVIHDSTDVWTRPECFKLDENGRPTAQAGVPPDYFSETGQLWGNPVYRWDVIKKTGYDWWTKRIAHNLTFFDLVRVDHFRGLVAYWEVPASEKTAVNGKWVEAPATDFLNHLKGLFPDLPFVAEDLGTITPDVWEIMDCFNLPGMRVLVFAFGPDLPTNLYAPHNHVRNCIVYTGTHDNNTVKGWFTRELKPEDRERVSRYIGRRVKPGDAPWEMIRLAMMSVADTAVLPMQDLLGLEKEARMNKPASNKGNWEWRLLPEQITSSLAQRLGQMTEIYGRSADRPDV